ncbi:MAG: hypothetical protein J5733_08490, partial [Bacteroidaceae bacterium]|nr:hypothetical protein [Bacteroidaceae bacterium]
LSYARRKVDLSMVSGDAEEVRTYVTDRSRNLRLDTSLQDLHNMELPARSAVTVVISLEDATGIGNEELRMANVESAHAIYDLSGRRVANPRKGIYIKNGNKIVIR